jgi:hypothetical protein
MTLADLHTVFIYDTLRKRLMIELTYLVPRTANETLQYKYGNVRGSTELETTLEG